MTKFRRFTMLLSWHRLLSSANHATCDTKAGQTASPANNKYADDIIKAAMKYLRCSSQLKQPELGSPPNTLVPGLVITVTCVNGGMEDMTLIGSSEERCSFKG